jgi:hypothetical protein
LAKDSKKTPSGSGTRTLRDADTGAFVAAAKVYASSNNASKEQAREKLKELGISDRSGKLGKNYR